MGLIIDGFCGGGGASTGIRMALGRDPDIGLNHDEVAVAMHRINHPGTKHLCQNIWKAIPSEVAGKEPIDLAWFSPDCKHFSKAKGGKPVKRNIRDLAWVVVAWAKLPRWQRPALIFVENVEEFVTWGPLGEDGRPCIKRGGEYFRKWVRELRRLGYKVDWKEIVAADEGTPTIRKRLFVIARNDGRKIVWPAPTHGKPKDLEVIAGRKKPWRTAADSVIDWSLPCPSIFATSAEIMEQYGVRAIRPLAPNTMARIARGVDRYVLKAAAPFIVPMTHAGDARVHDIDEPLRTVTTAHRGEHAVIQPFLSRQFGASTGSDIDAPAPTVMPNGGGKTALVVPHVTKFNRGATGHSVEEPLHTITAAHSDTHPGAAAPLGLVSATIVGVGSRAAQSPERPADAPMSTITATKRGQHAVVTPFLAPRYLEKDGADPRVRSVEEPAATVTGGGQVPGMLIAPTLIQTGYGERPEIDGKPGQAPRSLDIHKPLGTVVDGQKHAVVATFLAQHNSERGGAIKAGRSASDPLSTVTATGGQQNVVAAFLAQNNTGEVGHAAESPVSTIVQKGSTQAVVSAGLLNLKGSDRRGPTVEGPSPTQCAGGTHIAEVRAFLLAYFGTDQDARLDDPMHTQTTKHRFGLVTVHGEQYEIVDIGMRMLTPAELFRAQGFPKDYIIDRGIFADGTVRAFTKTEQIRLCGNSVCPQVAAALVAANFHDRSNDAPLGTVDFQLEAAE